MNIEEEIYAELVKRFDVGEICIKKRGKRKQLTWLEFIEVALKLETKELYTICGFADHGSFGKFFRREYTDLLYHKNGRHWNTYLLSLLDKKRCPVCKEIKDTINFYRDNNSVDGKSISCISCQKLKYKDNIEVYAHYRLSIKDKQKDYFSLRYINNKSLFRYYTAKRRAVKLQATPKWADLEAIKEIYNNCPPGYHIDHEIPLQGELVCGLHVHKNLKPIPAAENLAKGNKYEII